MKLHNNHIARIMDREKKKMCREPQMYRTSHRKALRILTVLLTFVLTVTLFPAEALVVQVAGNTIETDGEAVTWDFRDQNAAIYQELHDGSLSVSGSLSHNGTQHGADIGDGTVFSIQVPAGQTTLTFGVCAYGSSSASISVDGAVVEENFSLNHAATDGGESSIQYTSESPTTITVTITGNGYLHSITAETITPPQVASVSGSVISSAGTGGSVEGETLVFTDEDGDDVETKITADGYEISLPVGHAYTVTFKNSEVYGVTAGGTVDLTDADNGSTVKNDISYKVIWDTSKEFQFTINGTTYTVKPGTSPEDDFAVEASGGNGSVELATTDAAIIWANLEGAGSGSLTSDFLGDVSKNVTYELSGNTITFTYEDAESSPTEYVVHVKDNSAPGKPYANGRTITYDFGDGSVVSKLYTGDYSITDGASVKSADGLVTVTGNNRIRYNDTHGIMISNGDQISVKVAGNAEIQLELCSYAADNSTFNVAVTGGTGTVTPESASAKVSADGDTASIQYTGEAATLTFTYNGNGSGYLHSMAVTNELPQTDITEQEEMPSVPDYGDADSMTVSAVGQQLTLTQEGGSLRTGEALSSSVGYYGFNLTADLNKLEADVTVNSCGNSSSNGVFFGAFNGEAIETIGIRNSTNLRGVYSAVDKDTNEGQISAGRLNESITEGQTVHFTAEKTEDGFVITATPEGGETYTMTSDNDDTLFGGNVENAELSFGFILADASVTVTNMKYYNADGNLLYDQNDCYEAIGTAPVVTAVRASSADTRDAIVVNWSISEAADGDGRYVIQVKKDNGEMENVAETTVTQYTYPVTEAGTYEFRVGGKLGSEGEVTWCEDTATVENFLPALTTPVVTLTANAASIDVSWTASEEATEYKIYRYSSDEGADEAEVVYTADSTGAAVVEGNTSGAADSAADTGTDAAFVWTDTTVKQEVPYYYYVIAYQYGDGSTGTDGRTLINSSNPSETVWAMASAGHTGAYVYEDEAAKITLTECPDETVFQNNISIGGTVDRAGQLTANVNGTQAASQSVAAGGAFRLNLSLEQGRNTVELLFTDSEGKVTRETCSFVYLTNYDKIVDASYIGEDGAKVNGVPTYKTVQAAVDSVPANNTERQVIYIKSGDYEERLVVESPYISLLGEDQDSVRIHCYPADLYPDDEGYEAGGDMSKRCAAFITDTAVGFSAENITFANDYVYGTPDGKSNKSADALRCDAEGATFVNVTISGVQDTLYMNAGHQYFYQCRIEGLIDFIYSGDDARALFEDCEIVFVYEETHPEGGYVFAPRTAADASYGLIFNNCVITSEDGCVNGTFCLARPWGPNASIHWINCYMGSAINAEEPYADMSGNLHTAARFYECGSYGPGYAVNADRRQVSQTAAQNLLSDVSLGWEPDSAVQAVSDAYVGTMTPPEEPTTEEPTTEEPSTDTEVPGTDNPGAEEPTTSDSQDSQTSSAGLTGGMLLTDKKNEAVYRVDGDAASGYTLTCVRAASRYDSVVKIPASVIVNGVSYPVTAIAAKAFKGNKELKKVVIGANVTTIGKKAFKGCSSLKKIVIRSKNLQKVGAKAFINIDSGAVIKVPGGKKKAYKKLFTKKTGIRRSMRWKRIAG